MSNRLNKNIDFTIDLGISYFFKKEIADSITIELKNNEDWIMYFWLCNSIGGVCSYLSSFVFNRELFLSSTDYEPYLGSCYVHVYMIMKGLLSKNNPVIKIISDPFIINRSGNDSFYKTPFQRFILDFNGYIFISNIFEDYLVRCAFLDVLKREHPIIPLKVCLFANKNERQMLISNYKKLGYSEIVVELMDSILKHKVACVLLLLKKIYKSIIRRIKAKL